MSREVAVHVPDIGDFDSVDVVEILVAPGDRVAVEDPLVSLESDKATMEVPSPVSGEVLSIKVSLGDAVSEGSLLLMVAADDEPASAAKPDRAKSARAEAAEPAPQASPPPKPSAPKTPATRSEQEPSRPPSPPRPPAAPFAEARGVDRPVRAHAGPLIRREARELGVDLAQVPGSGRAGRVLEADLKAYVRQSFERGGTTAAAAARRRMADLTDLETWRRRIPVSEGASPPSTLAVVIKALVSALRAFPDLTGGTGEPLDVGVAEADDAGSLVRVRDAGALGLRAIVAALEADTPEGAGGADGERGEPTAERKAPPTFRLVHGLGARGHHPEPLRAERDLFAVAVGPLEVRPRWSGTPEDALRGEGAGRFEPRVMIELSVSLAPDLPPDLGARFLDHWAEILAAPARLLL